MVYFYITQPEIYDLPGILFGQLGPDFGESTICLGSRSGNWVQTLVNVC